MSCNVQTAMCSRLTITDAFVCHYLTVAATLSSPVYVTSECCFSNQCSLVACLPQQLVPVGGAGEVDFWLVNDPSINLNRGRRVEPAQLASLMGKSHSN